MMNLVTKLKNFFDTDCREDLETRGGPDWRRIVPFLALHLGCFAVLWVGWSWTAVLAAAGLYLARMFAITAFYHRYFSHRAFKTSRPMQFLFAVWGNTAMQRGALWWCAHHRHHHSHSDDHPDHHSPVQKGFWWSHLGWLIEGESYRTDYSKIKDWSKFPELVFLNRFDLIVPLLYGLGLFFTGWALEAFLPGLGTNGWQLFVWGFFISTVVLMHGTFCVNSIAHIWGSRRFKTKDDSRNNGFVALITLGEGWHNNHHRYQHSARQGFFWWEIDITYYLLRGMQAIGLISGLRPVPARIYQEADTN